jgi:hypothetical protein
VQKEMNFSTFTKIILLSAILTLASCSLPKPCGKEASAYGNLDGVFNTKYNEFSPQFFDGKLYFTMMPVGSQKTEKIYYSVIKDTGFTKPVEAADLPHNWLKNAGTISFYSNKNITELYCAGVSPKSKQRNRDIFISKKIKGKWTEPEPIREINSQYYESYPFISSDGNILIFSSDRPNGFGGIDLYYSYRNSSGKWSTPKNLGNEINTSENEISAFLDKNNNLYFASKGHNSTGGYDIFKANYKGNFTWGNVTKLPFPINTEFDETGPAIYKGFIYLASNRKDGCGARDLYSFQICGDVILSGKVYDKSNEYSPAGTANLYNENHQLVSSIKVNEDGLFEFNLSSDNIYFLEYTNNCLPLFIPEQKIVTSCNDTSVEKIVLPIELPHQYNSFKFENYKIPFFVTGYYKPNVPENLNDLRNLFQMNLLGNEPATQYIQYPTEEYDSYSIDVQDAMNEVLDKIKELLANKYDDCNLKQPPKITLNITGFSDDRGFSNVAKYMDEDLNDKLLPYLIKKGDAMNNDLLSLLRAFYTAKYLQEKLIPFLKEHPEYSQRLLWEINAGGVLNENQENIFNRRVKIEVGLKE